MQEARQIEMTEAEEAQNYERYMKGISDKALENEIKYQCKHGTDKYLSIALREQNRRDTQ